MTYDDLMICDVNDMMICDVNFDDMIRREGNHKGVIQFT